MSEIMMNFGTFMFGFISGACVGIVLFIILGYAFVKKGNFDKLTKTN